MNHEIWKSDRESGREASNETQGPVIHHRRGAVGKALLVYLFSGSAVAALLAFVLFRGMGC